VQSVQELDASLLDLPAGWPQRQPRRLTVAS
jgi:hypothetical protein